MTLKKRGLGRGLANLLSDLPVKPAAQDLSASENTQKLPIECLQRGKFQPRKQIDQAGLEELANSIRAHGIIQPIVVRPVDQERYEIIAGERRWRAAQLANLTEVPVIIHHLNDEETLAFALIENIQRENLSPLDEARALKRLMDEFQLTQEEVAQTVGKPRTTITNYLRLLNLNADVQNMLEKCQIEMGHAKALLSLPLHQQEEVAHQVFLRGLSVREAESWVKKLLNPKPITLLKPSPSADIHHIQQRLSETLGARVSLNHTQQGNGKLVINYSSVDELHGILDHIK